MQKKITLRGLEILLPRGICIEYHLFNSLLAGTFYWHSLHMGERIICQSQTFDLCLPWLSNISRRRYLISLLLLKVRSAIYPMSLYSFFTPMSHFSLLTKLLLLKKQRYSKLLKEAHWINRSEQTVKSAVNQALSDGLEVAYCSAMK